MAELKFLRRERSLPDRDGLGRVVHWHVFRAPDEAHRFAHNVLLGDGQTLVGGYSRDSVGPFWWVGVQVADLGHWGSSRAINKRAD